MHKHIHILVYWPVLQDIRG